MRSRRSRERKNRRRGDSNRVAHAARKRAPDAFEGFLEVNRLDADKIVKRALREQPFGARAAGALAMSFDERAEGGFFVRFEFV